MVLLRDDPEVLADLAKTAPDAVRAFVASHEGRMSGLSRREALKNL